jgi:plasmid maintenance system antidote protein VapI
MRKILVHKMAKDGYMVTKEALEREISNVAKTLGVEPEDLKEFIREILPEVMAAKLGCKKVSIVW